MNCLGVRERLPEHALSVLEPRETAAIERHLQWCAGCRKEAAELGQAAATVGFALAPAPLPTELERRVVETVRGAVGTGSNGRRRTRSAVAAVLATAVAVAGLGWGAVMAGRADRFRQRADQALRQKIASLEQFRKVLTGLGVRVPSEDARLGRLAPAPNRRGGGAVLVFVSPTVLDFAVVIVNGLEPKDAGALPYKVTLANAEGVTLPVGKITALDADGGAQVFHEFNHDLSPFTKVVVRNAAGAVVLQGTVGPESQLASS